MKQYKVFAINPGSTSTKIAMYEGDNEIFSRNVSHDAEKLKEFKEISDQFDYRKETILKALEEEGLTLEGVDAFSARGGGLVNVEGGVYEIGEKLLEHARTGFTVKHPATLGAQLADAFRKEYGGTAFVVNPPDVDEFRDVARVTGLKGVYRESRIHALNQKEIGIRYAAAKNMKYEDMNLIICHIGGGISVTAHEKGRMIDSDDIANGDGPMAPTRCGQLPVRDVVKMCYSGKYTEREMYNKITKTGGLVDHLGTSDAREVRQMMESGNEYASLVYNAMIYQIGKTAGAMAAALKGKVDDIVFTGGISHDQYLVEHLSDMLNFIAPITVMAGEFEMEALAAGAVRVLSGTEQAKVYTGVPVWDGFDCALSEKNTADGLMQMEDKKVIAVIYGDGVGPEMMRPALRALEAVCRRFGHTVQILPVEAAGDAVLKYGDPLPAASAEICQKAGAVLFGNSGLRCFNDYPPEKRPEYALLRLRKCLGVTTNIRPVKIYRKLADLSPLRKERLKAGMDMVFVRDIVGGVLASEKKEGLGIHGQEAYEYEYYNEDIIRQTAEIAFSLAEKRRCRVTSLDKANVLGSSRLWRRTVEETAVRHPDVCLSSCFVDSGAMQLIREPWRFDVVLSSNMFGDIISDEGTELTGTPFLYGSAEIAPGGKGIYTPNQLHWGDESAIGKQIVNPVGMMDAVRLMLLLSFGWRQEAECLEKAVSEVLHLGYATRDIMLEGSRLVSTDKMGALIEAEILR